MLKAGDIRLSRGSSRSRLSSSQETWSSDMIRWCLPLEPAEGLPCCDKRFKKRWCAQWQKCNSCGFEEICGILWILTYFEVWSLAIPTQNPPEVLREVSRLSTPEVSNPDAACPLSQRAIGHSGSLWCLGTSTYCAFPVAAWGNKDLLSCSNSCLMIKSQSSSIPVDRCWDT